MSAYDLLPADERDAIAWVREHGGLERVKKLLDWVVGHCSTKQQLDFDFWLSGRVMYELGFEEDMADRDEVERRLLARLMPEGMEWLVEAWPRLEDGEPVGFGDEVSRIGEVFAIFLYRDGSFALNFHAYSKGERVRRPAPAVPASDGEPLEVGQTVWDTNGDELVIGAIEDGGHTVTCRYADVGDGIPTHGMWSPSDLTHQRPDTWERLEEDAGKDYVNYWGCERILCSECPAIADGKKPDERYNVCHCAEAMKCDIVRRAKALAERERGES